MNDNCQLVVFSNKAYNALIRESFDKNPVETGGILLGHILDNGIWLVMEVLPPGINSIFEYAYFEYDEAFVNYLAQSVANQYKRPLDLLGLWHRHPGSMDVFSTTDDGTNSTFASLNPAGAISGLVNIDPVFRLTMYHLDHTSGSLFGRPAYQVVDVEVGDDIIPEEYFELRYYNGDEADLHPAPGTQAPSFQPRQVAGSGSPLPPPVPEGDSIGSAPGPDGMDISKIISGQLPPCSGPQDATPQVVKDFFIFWRDSKKKWLYVLIAAVVIIIYLFTIRTCRSRSRQTESEQNIEHTERGRHTEKSEKAPDTSEPRIEALEIPADVNEPSTTPREARRASQDPSLSVESTPGAADKAAAATHEENPKAIPTDEKI